MCEDFFWDFLVSAKCRCQLSKKIALKNPNTTIKYQGDNPKTPGSKAHQRFEKYKASQTIGEATAAGANWQDLAGDFEKGLFTITPTVEEFKGTGSKRGAEESTPDREASARAKVAKDVRPCSLESVALAPSSSAKIETSKVEMSAVRTMMREELSNTLGEVESRITANVAATMEELQQELKKEREAREKMEQRIQKLEGAKHQEQRHMEDGRVDKEKVVIGGFVDMDNEEAEKLLTDVLCDVPGFQLAYSTTPTPAVAFAQFDTAVSAMNLKEPFKNEGSQTLGLTKPVPFGETEM